MLRRNAGADPQLLAELGQLDAATKAAEQAAIEANAKVEVSHTEPPTPALHMPLSGPHVASNGTDGSNSHVEHLPEVPTW